MAAFGMVVGAGLLICCSAAAVDRSEPFNVSGPVGSVFQILRPAVASNGTNWLVVWGNTHAAGGLSCVLVDGDGQVGQPITLADTLTASSPAVASDGTNYLVVWSDNRNMGGPSGADLYGARISGSGVLLEPAVFPIFLGYTDQYDPALAWDGHRYLLVWDDLRSGTNSDIFGLFLPATGNVGEPTNSFPICAQPQDQLLPSISCLEGTFLIAWEDYRNGPPKIYGTRINSKGKVMSRHGVKLSGNSWTASAPSIASTGKDFLLTWIDDHVTAFGHGTTLTRRVTLHGTSARILQIGYGDDSDPVVAADGTCYLVAWTSGYFFSSIALARVAGRSAVDVSASGTIGHSTFAALAQGPAGKHLLVQHELTNGVDGIVGTVLTLDK
jgi:hypothetical protein